MYLGTVGENRHWPINQQVSVPWCTYDVGILKYRLCCCLTSSQQVNSLEVTPDRSMIAAAGMFIITTYCLLIKSILSTNLQHRSQNLSVFFSVSRLPTHPHVWLELQQPKPSDHIRWRQQEHHVGGLPWGRSLDVHRGGGLHGSDLGPEVHHLAFDACMGVNQILIKC